MYLRAFSCSGVTVSSPHDAIASQHQTEVQQYVRVFPSFFLWSSCPCAKSSRQRKERAQTCRWCGGGGEEKNKRGRVRTRRKEKIEARSNHWNSLESDWQICWLQGQKKSKAEGKEFEMLEIRTGNRKEKVEASKERVIEAKKNLCTHTHTERERERAEIRH